MINNTESKSFHKVQSGVTEYPIGFQFFYNPDGTPQLEVVIGVTYLTFNHNCKLSEDNGTLILIPTEEEAEKLTGPDDFSWMDKWVDAPMVISRAIPFVQESDYQLGRISSEQIEKDFDLSVMRDQMLAGQIQEHTDDVQGEIDALNSRIDFVQEEHLLDMAAVDSQLATKATKTELENAKTVLGEGIRGNADAIQKTREDYIEADSEIHQILNNHAENLTTLHNDVDDLGDQVSEIESKIPESASETNQLVTKEDLKSIDLDDYVKKSGDTMTGDLRLVSNAELSFENRYGTMVIQQSPTGTGWQIINMRPNTNVAASALQATSTTLRFNPIVDTPGLVRLLGDTDYPWDNVYAKKLNNGADLIIPAEGGTLARMEDLIDLRADINEADSELQTQITAQAAEIATKAEKDSVYTKEQVDAKVSSVYKVKGSVANYDSLPTGANVGDVYNVLDTGINYVWTTDGWDALGGAVDLTDYAKKEDLSDYLPLTGGTLTGPVEIDYGKQEEIWDSVQLFTLTTRTYQNYPRSLIFSYAPDLGQLFINGMNSLAGLRELLPHAIDPSSIGNSALPWATVYTTKLNSGSSALSGHDLIVPDEGGTLARLEDVANTAGEIVGQAKEYVDEAIATTVNDIAAAKQDKLTAGEGITIEDNVISASGGGGDYLPLTGGTLTGGVLADVGLISSTLIDGQKPLFTATWTNPYSTKYSNFGLSATKDGLLIGQAQSLNGVIISQNGTLLPALTDASQSIGSAGKEFRSVFVKYLSNGTKGSDGFISSYLTVPNAKGTIARIEDIDAVVGDISTALTAILGE